MFYLHKLRHFSSKKYFVATSLLIASMLGSLVLPGPMIPPAQAQHAEIASQVQSLKRSSNRWIQVDLSTQRLTAWQGNQQIHSTIISTGQFSSPTPIGVFAVQSKHRVARMQGEDYDIHDVPFTLYYSGNYAIHGAYWHQNFGVPISHGCINMAIDHAEWLFNWANVGTPVVVQV